MNKENLKNAKKPIELKRFWIRLWQLLKPFHKVMKGIFMFVVIFEAIRLIPPYLLKMAIDLVTSFSPDKIGQILILILAMFLVGQLNVVIDYFLDKSKFRVVANAEEYLAGRAHKKMLELSLSYHERENTGNKISKIQRGVDKITEFLGNVLWDVGPTMVQIILTTGALFYIDHRFGFVFLIFVPIFVFLTLRANKKLYPLRVWRHDRYEESSGIMAQSIININTVKSFVQEKREESQHKKLLQRIKEGALKEFGIMFKYNIKRSFVLDLGRITVLLLGVYFVWNGLITIGSLVFVFTISEKAFLSLWRITRLYDKIMESSEAIIRLSYLEKEKSDIVNKKNGIKPKNIQGKIEFKNVDFTYKDSRHKALDDVSLKINSGCVTALVGPSGGGKTTLARMIYRHYDPQSGEVKLDETNVKDYDLHSFRKFIAIVPQEVEIFNSSVKDNIAYSNPQAGFDAIKAAARIANAEEFINNLSDGYETLVGERGIKLSGGQRQRIGIARAILANPAILIFDEATSNLDSQSEKLIQEAMDKIQKGRTVIIIAHRLSTIKKADKIVVLENGKVQETGSHFELAQKQSGLYAKLLKLQKMGDVE